MEGENNNLTLSEIFELMMSSGGLTKKVSERKRERFERRE